MTNAIIRARQFVLSRVNDVITTRLAAMEAQVQAQQLQGQLDDQAGSSGDPKPAPIRAAQPNG
jgi:hypothetical protein